MDQASIRRVVVFVGITATYLGFVPQVSACCLTDWLFNRRKTAAPVPVATYYTPAAVAPAATGAACGPGQCQQTVVRYSPQVAYRTVWQPVPVTTYRRTVNYNPSTGLPITCTQPCTTYTYQARRVPYTTFRPVYSTVPVSAPTAAVTVAPAPSTFAAVPTTGACNTCPTPSTYGSYPSTGTPYYSTTPSTPTTPTPAAGSPPGATPWEPVGPTTPPQSPSAWPPATNGSGATPDPADLKPRIDPDANNSFSSLRRPPSAAPRSRWYPSEGYATSPNVPGQSAGQQPIPNYSSGSSAMSNTPTPAPPSVPYDVRPLPNIDRQSEGANPQSAPSLNPTRDRTAWVRPIPTRWASSPIPWPERQAEHTVKVDNEPSQPPIRQLDGRRLNTRRVQTHQRFSSDSDSSSWDQSGWRSAQR